MTLDLAKLKALHAAATQGEWKYRPNEHDDWGYIRDSTNKWAVAIARTGRCPTGDEANIHRLKGTDPHRDNGEYICALHNAATGLIARAELATDAAEVIEHLYQLAYQSQDTTDSERVKMAPAREWIRRYREMEADHD